MTSTMLRGRRKHITIQNDSNSAQALKIQKRKKKKKKNGGQRIERNNNQ